MNISFNENNNKLLIKGIRSLITYYKLKLYLSKIIELENNVKYKIVALTELKKELTGNLKIRNIINRRNSINNEIDNLMRILYVFFNQKNAIYNKVSACQMEYKTFIGKEYTLETHDNKYLSDRYEKLMEYANALLSEKSITYANSFDDIVNKVASLERELEIYVYTHINDVKKMRETIDNYDFNLKKVYLKETTSDKSLNFNEDDLHKLEIKYRAYYEFGKNVVTMDDLYKLYKLKFDYKVSDIFFCGEKEKKFLNDKEKRDDIEYSIYIQIIEKMLEKILKNDNHILSSQIDNDSKLLKNFRYLLCDSNRILNSNILLAFLLATYTNNLHVFFSKYRVKTPEFIKNYLEQLKRFDHNKKSYFILEDEIPFEILAMILKDTEITYYKNGYQIHSFDNPFIKKIDHSLEIFANIYTQLQKKIVSKETDVFIIPEGFVEIYRAPNRDIYKYGDLPWGAIDTVIYLLIKLGQGKLVYTPNSLKKVNAFTFENSKMEGLFLNEGLKIFENDCIRKLKVRELNVPSTLVSPDIISNFDKDYLKMIHNPQTLEPKQSNNKYFR